MVAISNKGAFLRVTGNPNTQSDFDDIPKAKITRISVYGDTVMLYYEQREEPKLLKPAYTDLTVEGLAYPSAQAAVDALNVFFP